jgi:hypothetical protein
MSRSRHDLTRTFPEIAVALSAQPRDDGLIVFDGAVEALRTASAAARRRQPGLEAAHWLRGPLLPVRQAVVRRNRHQAAAAHQAQEAAGRGADVCDPLRLTEHRERDRPALTFGTVTGDWTLSTRETDLRWARSRARPGAARVQRTCVASGLDSGKRADRQRRCPAPPPRSTPDAVSGRARLMATANALTSRAEPALDVTGPGRRPACAAPPVRTGAGTPRRMRTAPTAAAQEPGPCPAPLRNVGPLVA